MRSSREVFAFVCFVALLLVIACPASVLAQREVPLKLWMLVKGTDLPNYGKMGLFVAAVPAGSPNLPYCGAVSANGRTNFYTFKNPLDARPAYSIRGEHLLLGDLNGDGLTDAVVANYQGGYSRSGHDSVLVYWGVAKGFDTVHAMVFPGWGSGAANLMPACVADVNNDGHPDLLLAASPVATDELQIFLGPQFHPAPERILSGDSLHYYLGWAGWGVAVADLNADGLNDLVVRGAFGRLTDSNWVRVYWGRPSSLPLDSVSEIHGGRANKLPVACLDVNGDGVADLLYADPGLSGKLLNDIYVHLGGPHFSTQASFTLDNPGGVGDFGESSGNAIISAGDMNGDGFSDIAVGAYELNTVDGFVFVFGGGARVDGKFDAAVGQLAYNHFGWTLAPIGDVNGDGLADLLVGAPYWDFGDARGSWAVILGSKAMTVTGLAPDASTESQPSVIELKQNYPNPFNPKTVIEYTIAGGGTPEPAGRNTRLSVFDVLGREVTVLVDEVKPPGTYRVTFDGTRLASGVYTYRLTFGELLESRTMILLK